MNARFSTTVFLFFFALLLTPTVSANDGVYFTSGSFLVPVKETDISAKKEILTITICKDGYANVDVDYTFYNNSSEKKNVTMAFEAHPPYCSETLLNKNGIHPFISQFTVEMNGALLQHRNALVALKFVGESTWESDHKPLDMTQWKGVGEAPDSIVPFENAIYNEALDSVISYAYAYYFNATFRPGENKVHHTYRYRMGYAIDSKFLVPYWLTPVTRWANGQVDDFTMRIKTDGKIEEILLADSIFKGSEFKNFYPPVYHIKHWDVSYIFATISEHPLEWHSANFSPKADMEITSGDYPDSYEMRRWSTEGKVVIDKNGKPSRYLADTDDGYFVSVQDYGVVPREGARVVEYSAEKGQGIVYLNAETKAANVRLSPTKKSKVLCVIKDEEGELPETYPCLGLVTEQLPDGDYKQWFKIKVGKRVGYVSRDLMVWDSICTF